MCTKARQANRRFRELLLRPPHEFESCAYVAETTCYCLRCLPHMLTEIVDR